MLLQRILLENIVHSYTGHKIIKSLCIQIAYAFVVLLVLEGCQGCNQAAVAPNEYETISKLGGIPNLGNTCYMNSVLQIIAKLYPDIFEGKDDALAKAGQVIVDKIKDDQDYVTEEDAEVFYDALLEYPGVNFEEYEQEDSEECLMVLLQNSVIQPYYYVWNRMISFNNERTIYNHGGWREQVDHYPTTLKIALPDNDNDNVTMQACLEHSFRDEDLVGEDQYRDAYLGLVDAIRQARLAINSNSNAPLAIHLLRFTNAGGKNKKNVTDALQLTVPTGVQYSPNGDTSDLHYCLQGFIVHSGGDTIHSGHYVAYINREGQWRLYNDARVKKVSQAEAEQAAEQAYLLFYKTNLKKLNICYKNVSS